MPDENAKHLEQIKRANAEAEAKLRTLNEAEQALTDAKRHRAAARDEYDEATFALHESIRSPGLPFAG